MRFVLFVGVPLLCIVALAALRVWSAGGGAPAAALDCALGACPTELHQTDSGGTFTYRVTSRFTVVLERGVNPPAHLRCTPEGIIGSISNVPSVAEPYYAARFEAVAPGTCDLRDDGFSATIIVQ